MAITGILELIVHQLMHCTGGTHSHELADRPTVVAPVPVAPLAAIAIVDNALGEDAQVEEGVHAHSHPARAHEHAGELDKGTLHGSALLTTIAITLHNFPEGLATFIATLAEPSLGIALAVAIAVHNVPEGMAVAMPVYYASGSKWKGFMWATLSGLSEPIGGIVGWLMLRNSLTNTGFGVVFAIVGGMMVFIVIHEMVPLAVKYDQECALAAVARPGTRPPSHLRRSRKRPLACITAFPQPKSHDCAYCHRDVRYGDEFGALCCLRMAVNQTLVVGSSSQHTAQAYAAASESNPLRQVRKC
jgi:zinc transporter ZupT